MPGLVLSPLVLDRGHPFTGILWFAYTNHVRLTADASSFSVAHGEAMTGIFARSRVLVDRDLQVYRPLIGTLFLGVRRGVIAAARTPIPGLLFAVLDRLLITWH